MYDPDKLQEINNSVNLVDYIGKTIDLEKRSKNYFGCCPLHEDKTPSFSVDPERNFYYCFSCHKSGKIINFLRDYEGMSFQAAVEKAAALADMDLKKLETPETIAFMKNMKRQKAAKPKKIERQILDESILYKYKKGFSEEWAAEGIGEETQTLFGVRIDTKGNRIIYPVFDNSGRLINVKGRTRFKDYKDLGIPKYISYYPVGTLDYFQGLNVTRQAAKKKNELILFESVKSVMKCYEWGFDNCASLECSNMTDEQVAILVGMGCDVVIALDNDMDFTDKKTKSLRRKLNKLKGFVGVYVIEDREGLLGDKSSKNSPADCGREVWEKLYRQKRAW